MKQAVKPPSEQEITDHLKGLNRVYDSAVTSSASARAKTQGINNYLTWFDRHNLTVYQDKQDNKRWKVQPKAPEEPQPEGK